MNGRWLTALPHPIGFVFSGGAALGAVQVGMLRALAEAGIQPDIVVGSSVGALNGAVIADRGLAAGLPILETIWRELTRDDVFPGGLLSQARQLISTRISLFQQDVLAGLICQVLAATRFEALQLPFGALATELLTFHGVLFTSGRLHPALLASAAIPGVYPPVMINGKTYVDGALTAHVPLRAALKMGAASLVVLDAGDTCHRQEPPRHVAEMMAETLHAALRQRVRVEAPFFARQVPLLYLPAPCPISRGLFSFDGSAGLMAQSSQATAEFLATAPIPRAGLMSGGPHAHDDAPAELVTLARAG